MKNDHPCPSPHSWFPLLRGNQFNSFCCFVWHLPLCFLIKCCAAISWFFLFNLFSLLTLLRNASIKILAKYSGFLLLQPHIYYSWLNYVLHFLYNFLFFLGLIAALFFKFPMYPWLKPHSIMTTHWYPVSSTCSWKHPFWSPPYSYRLSIQFGLAFRPAAQLVGWIFNLSSAQETPMGLL